MKSIKIINYTGDIDSIYKVIELIKSNRINYYSINIYNDRMEISLPSGKGENIVIKYNDIIELNNDNKLIITSQHTIECQD
jgi:hypothetical protein